MSSPQPLSHLRVIDLTRARSGPTMARQFADWGADVIMVESPKAAHELTGGRESGDFQNLHRNKRSIMLDLKREDCRAVFLDLVRSADVLLENFRPDVKHRLKIDYETLREINPRLVYGSISGFGEDGPNALRPGVDQIAQGYGGLMSVTGLPGQGPVRAGVAVTDTVSGLYATIGVMMALVERQVTGQGRWVRTSLLQSCIALLDFQATRWLVERTVPPQEGNHHPQGVPMGTFETADGHVNLAAAGAEMFTKFCRLVGREEWLTDERYATAKARYANRETLRAEITKIMKTRSSADWIKDCNGVGLPCGPIYTIDKMFEDPQVNHLAMTRKVTSAQFGELELVAQPIVVSDVSFDIRSAAPALGMDTKEVLRELGYDAARIDALWTSLCAEAEADGRQPGSTSKA